MSVCLAGLICPMCIPSSLTDCDSNGVLLKGKPDNYFNILWTSIMLYTIKSKFELFKL